MINFIIRHGDHNGRSSERCFPRVSPGPFCLGYQLTYTYIFRSSDLLFAHTIITTFYPDSCAFNDFPQFFKTDFRSIVITSDRSTVWLNYLFTARLFLRKTEVIGKYKEIRTENNTTQKANMDRNIEIPIFNNDIYSYQYGPIFVTIAILL